MSGLVVTPILIVVLLRGFLRLVATDEAASRRTQKTMMAHVVAGDSADQCALEAAMRLRRR